MDLDKLNILPDWNFYKAYNQEGANWEDSETWKAAKPMYFKWREIFGLISAVAENLTDEPGHPDDPSEAAESREFIYQHAMIVASKITSASAPCSYVLKMEDAAMIRHSCLMALDQINFAVLLHLMDPGHQTVIEEAMNEFKVLTKAWVSTFVKDGVEDEWGVF